MLGVGGKLEVLGTRSIWRDWLNRKWVAFESASCLRE